MTLLAGALMALAHLLFGSVTALEAVRQRSVYIELANGEMEGLRALPYDALGAREDDPDFATAYPGGEYEGKEAVVVTSDDAPAIVTTSDGGTKDAPVPYTVRRWVTWSGVNGGDAIKVKRITVVVEWQENRKATRHVRLVSSKYPGGNGEFTLPNHDPIADVAASPSSGIVADSTYVSFNGTASIDEDGDALTYTWQFGDGSSSVTGPTAGHTYIEPGIYTAQLTVTDGKGGVDIESRTMEVTTEDGNLPPTAVLSTSAADGVAPFSVNANGSASWDPNNDPLTYIWSWGDGTADGVGVNATHKYTTAGTFWLALTVRDPGGLASTVQTPITVSPLNCDVIDGFLRNPSSNALTNDIKVTGADKPQNTAFLIRATTNEACSSLSIHLPTATGVWIIDLTLVADTGTLKTWQASTTWTRLTDRFATGNAQTAELWSPGASGSAERFPFSFSVHR